jgi:hypothetical protein
MAENTATTAYTEAQLAAAANALAGHDEMAFGRWMNGRPKYSCECGELLGEARDEYEGWTDDEFEDAMLAGRRHLAELALNAALGA